MNLKKMDHCFEKISFLKSCFLMVSLIFFFEKCFSQTQRIPFNNNDAEDGYSHSDEASSHYNFSYGDDSDLLSRHMNHMSHMFDNVRKMFHLSFDFPRSGRRAFHQNRFYSSGIDILKKDDCVIVKCVLPGVQKQNIDIRLKDNVLIISVQDKSGSSDKKEENSKYFYRSIQTYSAFSKKIPLPDGVDKKSITASYKNGVLRIEAKHRSVKDNSQKILVQ